MMLRVSIQHRSNRLGTNGTTKWIDLAIETNDNEPAETTHLDLCVTTNPLAKDASFLLSWFSKPPLERF